MKSNLDPKSRDWTMDDVDVDPRFVACKKEAILAFIMFAVHTVVFVCIYVFIAAKPENWTYLLGMPLHMFLMILDIVVFLVEICLVVDKVFKDMDMSPIGKIVEKK